MLNNFFYATIHKKIFTTIRSHMISTHRICTHLPNILVSPAQLNINFLKVSKYKHPITKLSPIISVPNQESDNIINDHSYVP